MAHNVLPVTLQHLVWSVTVEELPISHFVDHNALQYVHSRDNLFTCYLIWHLGACSQQVHIP